MEPNKNGEVIDPDNEETGVDIPGEGNEEELVGVRDENDEENSGNDERDFESEAREQGWRPKEEWNGPDDGWKDAETFVKDGERFLPFVQQQLKKERKRLAETTSEFQERIARLEQANKAARKAEREQLLSQLREARKEAIASSDGDRFDEIDEQIGKLREEEINDTDESTGDEANLNTPPQVLIDWQEDNKWYGKSKAMTALADMSAMQYKQQHPNASAEQILDHINSEIKNEFPDYFTNPRRSRSSTVSKNSPAKGSSGGNTRGKTFANLPEEAKAACKEFVADGIMTQEQYVKSYFNSSEE